MWVDDRQAFPRANQTPRHLREEGRLPEPLGPTTRTCPGQALGRQKERRWRAIEAGAKNDSLGSA